MRVSIGFYHFDGRLAFDDLDQTSWLCWQDRFMGGGMSETVFRSRWDVCDGVPVLCPLSKGGTCGRFVTELARARRVFAFWFAAVVVVIFGTRASAAPWRYSHD